MRKNKGGNPELTARLKAMSFQEVSAYCDGVLAAIIGPQAVRPPTPAAEPIATVIRLARCPDCREPVDRPGLRCTPCGVAVLRNLIRRAA